jgi:isopropylmalate/homocitrate/citramalate synthase
LLLDAGIRSMVVGFPVVSEEERRAVVECFKLKRNPDVLMWCLSRATRGDIDRSIECGAKHVGIFVAVSDIHLKHKLRLDENEALARTMDVARYAASKGLSVHVGLEDGTRAPIERVLRFFSAAAEAGAQHVGLADTVGILTPLSTYHIVSKLAKAAAPLPLSVHFHDDLGMAVANTICAAQAGARRLMGAFGGLGDRAGNACLEEVAVTLRVKFGLDLGIDYVKLANAARRAAEHARLVVPPNKPIIGENVFSHEAGIHVQGLVNDLSTYEPFPPELVGRAHEVHVGKHSGVASMRYLARVNGLHASDTVLEQALHRVKTTAQDCGRPTTAAEAIAILREQIALDDT